MRILRGLTSRLLPCGCLAGVYETYNGIVVTLLDERLEACPDTSHVEGNEIPALADVAARPSPAATQPRTPRRR